jgi:hypothetical protein
LGPDCPGTKDFERKLKAALNGSDRDAQSAGQKLGRSFTTGMGSEMSRGGTQVGRQAAAAVSTAAGSQMMAGGRRPFRGAEV